MTDLDHVDFISDQERENFARAKLGEDTITFLNSPVGRYLHGCAKQEVEELRDALEQCNPDTRRGRRKIARLQLKAQSARYFMSWCSDAITDGEFAFKALENQEQ